MDRRTTLVAVAAALLLTALPATGSPVCSDEPRAACGGRIFPEAESTVSFLQHDNGEFEAGIKALEEEFPRYVKVRRFSQILGEETLSVEGRDIWMIEITDFQNRGDEIPVAVSLSVHGPERAGIEGGVRYAEDLVRWATDDPDHELRNGTEKDSVAFPVKRVIDDVHLYLTNINPDGWASGDVANGGIYSRGNGNNVDLNREFPTKGWTEVDYTALSEPETKAWDKVARDISPVTASDLHGQITSPNNAYADIMYPAGQWDPLEIAKVERLARHMKSNVERYFEMQAVALEEGMRPAEYATAYDVVGYDDSGFMGDWFTEKIGAVEVDVEHTFSHMAPNSAWVAANEKAHIAAVRGEIETVMIEAMVQDSIDAELDLGRTAYLFDPRRVTSADGYGGPKPPNGIDPQSYDVSRMQFFTDLGRYTTKPLKRIESGNVRGRKLTRVDSLVIAGRPFPPDPDGDRVNRKRISRTIKRWVKRGGNLVLTDGALRFLPKLKIVKKSAVSAQLHNAGHIEIEDFEDRYLKGVHHTASQTYYEVPLGYSVDDDFAPHYTVARDPWEAAGGKTIAHIGSQDSVGLGRVELGNGTVGIFGALLPDPTERFDHLYGLADYAVTVAGSQILNNMLVPH